MDSIKKSFCKFRLYVCGKSKNNSRIEARLRNILEKKLSDTFSLKVIDLLENPEYASRDSVIATPTLVKVSPAPSVKVIGDLAEGEILFKCLRIQNAT